ncbi:GerAB/ArcD/ProY family transporter [Caminicella sporogenes]|uniref:GerAB/ArcD/ProY family transporter n=1 Tax=Caminicella sporogenes TaxID=166485 RepID=UPI002541FC4B|nr:endospore germination permease [Caminicella sporogenes]WIF95762.1 endospore germination permease [Caminicella sporogenes]
MKKEFISIRQGIALLVLFIIDGTVMLPTAAEAGKDLWMSIVISIIFTIPMIFIYSKLLLMYPHKDFFDILEIIFGKYIGKIIGILYIWFSFHLSALVLRDFGEVFNILLPETPMVIIFIPLLIVCVWGIKEGIEVLGRVAKFFMPLIIFFILFFVIVLIHKMNINNIRPVLMNGMKPVMKGAFSAFSFPFGEIIIFIMIFSSLQKEEKTYKVYLLGLIIGGVLILIIKLTNVLVIGINKYSFQYFPGIAAVRRAGVGKAIKSIEMLSFIIIFTGGFIKISISMLASIKGIAKLFDITDYRFIVVPMSLMMLNLAYIISDNIMDFVNWSAKIWPYYAFPFQVIIPVLIFITAKIRRMDKLKKLGGKVIE